MNKILFSTLVASSFITISAIAQDQPPTPRDTLDFLERQIEKSIIEMDKDGDQSISEEEYIKNSIEQAAPYDKNDDKSLSKDEYTAFILNQLNKAIPKGNKAMSEEIEKVKKTIDTGTAMLLQQFDLDKSNSLNEDEFRAIQKQGFISADYNQDKQLNILDVEAIKKKMGL